MSEKMLHENPCVCPCYDEILNYSKNGINRNICSKEYDFEKDKVMEYYRHK